MLTAADGAAMAATADPQIFTAGSFTFKLTGDLVFLASNERGGWTLVSHKLVVALAKELLLVRAGCDASCNQK